MPCLPAGPCQLQLLLKHVAKARRTIIGDALVLAAAYERAEVSLQVRLQVQHWRLGLHTIFALSQGVWL